MVLPPTFTGRRRYRVMNYQDAMARYRVCGPPGLLVTFTCNTNWKKESEEFSHAFAGLCAIEYKKCNLPHTHCLVWLATTDSEFSAFPGSQMSLLMKPSEMRDFYLPVRPCGVSLDLRLPMHQSPPHRCATLNQQLHRVVTATVMIISILWMMMRRTMVAMVLLLALLSLGGFIVSSDRKVSMALAHYTQSLQRT